MSRTQRVLVVGQGRSGTTWVGRTLGAAPGATYVHEPDVPERDAFALRASAGLGPYPFLTADDAIDAAPAYAELWDGVLRGGQRSRDPRARLARRLHRTTPAATVIRHIDSGGQTRSARLRVASALAASAPAWAPGGAEGGSTVAKSVNAMLSAEWIAHHFGAQVVVVVRHPLDVVASRLELGWGIGALRATIRTLQPLLDDLGVRAPDDGASELSLIAFQIGAFATALTASASRHAWPVVRHEDLCRSPIPEYQRLFGRVGLDWSPEVEAYLADADQPGAGWEVRRRAADQPDRWRVRLATEQVAEARSVLEQFPTADDSYEYV